MKIEDYAKLKEYLLELEFKEYPDNSFKYRNIELEIIIIFYDKDILITIDRIKHNNIVNSKNYIIYKYNVERELYLFNDESKFEQIQDIINNAFKINEINHGS